MTEPQLPRGRLLVAKAWPFDGADTGNGGTLPAVRAYDDRGLRKRIEALEKALADGSAHVASSAAAADLQPVWATIDVMLNHLADLRNALRVLTLGTWAARARDMGLPEAIAEFDRIAARQGLAQEQAISQAIDACYAMETALIVDAEHRSAMTQEQAA